MEDQLDDVQGQNEILEQNVTRLNLNIERLRSDAQRASEAKDEELEESRTQFQRRLRAYEEQVSELNAANGTLQRQIRVLEQRGRQFETQSQYSFESSTNNYKREYKKTLAMLKVDLMLIACVECPSSYEEKRVMRLLSLMLDVSLTSPKKHMFLRVTTMSFVAFLGYPELADHRASEIGQDSLNPSTEVST